MDPKPDKLKAKIEEQKTTGAISLSSADVAGFEPQDKAYKAVVGDVTAAVPKEATQDPLLKSGASGDPGKIVTDEVGATGKTEAATHDLVSDGPANAVLPTVTVTEQERELFIDSMITGTRFVLPFKLFGGKIHGKFRARSQRESQAIISRLSYETEQKHILSALDYSTRLRNMLMAAQIDELRNTKYMELKEPLMRIQGGDAVTEPGWLAQVALWEKEHEGLVSALYAELQIFERKYWLMVANAPDQNFWPPAEST
jgi:hypothetical protein